MVTATAASSAAPRAYYFGCWQQPGHYLHHVGGRKVRPEDGVPFDPFEGGIDGALAPRRATEHRFGLRPGEVFCTSRGKDRDERLGLHYLGEELPQGQFLLHRLRGHTLIAWWDLSQGDTRGACNSVFFVEGDRTAEEMLALWPRCFPLQAANLERAGVQLVEVNP